MSKQIEAIFKKYKDKSTDAILIDGTIEYSEALGFDVEDVGMLALSHYLGSTRVGEFPKEMFIRRWMEAKVKSLAEMRDFVIQLKEKLLLDQQYLQTIYNFAFTFSLEDKKKTIPRDLAVSYWRLLLTNNFNGEVLDKWCDFIENKWDSDIHKDQWQMVFPFLAEYYNDPTFQGYDETAAWPLLMDSFVEFVTGP